MKRERSRIIVLEEQFQLGGQDSAIMRCSTNNQRTLTTHLFLYCSTAGRFETPFTDTFQIIINF